VTEWVEHGDQCVPRRVDCKRAENRNASFLLEPLAMRTVNDQTTLSNEVEATVMGALTPDIITQAILTSFLAEVVSKVSRHRLQSDFLGRALRESDIRL
jgi:hypothetical protein